MTVSLSAAVSTSSSQAQASSSLSALNAAAQTSSQSSVTSKPLTSGSDAPISPRIVIDPQAGLITQFLSSSGILQSQIPSAAVVAYLKAGLTDDGLPKATTNAAPQPSQTSANANSATSANAGSSDIVA